MSTRETTPRTARSHPAGWPERSGEGSGSLHTTIIGLYKTEAIRRQGPWKNLDDVEYATLEWADWFNHRRILEPIGNIPPAEKEANHYRQTRPAEPAGLTQPRLH